MKKYFYLTILITLLGFVFKDQIGKSLLSKHVDTKKEAIIMVVDVRPKTLDPRFAQDALGMRISDLLYQSLVRVGPKFKIIGDLANKWVIRDNVYTFYLHPNIVFSNGKPLQKRDILYSFKEFMSDKSPFSSSFKIIKKVEVFLDSGEENSLQDDHKKSAWVIKIYLKSISAKFLSADLPVLKILSFSPSSTLLPLGSGAFQLQHYGINNIEISTNPHYLGSKKRHPLSTPLKTKKIIFKIVRDELTRYQKLLNQETDIMVSSLSPAKLDLFFKKNRKTKHFKIYKGAFNTVSYILLNLKDSCLSKKGIRNTLGLAIDRSSLIQYKMFGLAKKATSLLPPHHLFFNSHLTDFVHNKSRARQLLSSFPKCQKKEFILKCSTIKSAKGLCRVFASNWKNIGLSLKLEHLEWARMYEDLNLGHFQIAYLKWVGVVDPDIYRLAFHSKEIPPNGRNRSFYRNKELDLMLEKALVTINIEQRKRLYDEVQSIIIKDKVILPLWYEIPIALVNKNIINFKMTDPGDYRFLLEVEKTSLKR